MKIILATNNEHKVSEIKKILGMKGLKILSLLDFPQRFVPRENGKTFKENAFKKASAVAKRYKLTAVADDSGLCVNALKGGPGVQSARFVKPPVTSTRLCEKMLKVMKNVPASKRKAKFTTQVAVVTPEGKAYSAEGHCCGSIIRERRGTCGFGYDSVFMPGGFKRTFAEMTQKQKNSLSHRGMAFRKARIILARLNKA